MTKFKKIYVVYKNNKLYNKMYIVYIYNRYLSYFKVGRKCFIKIYVL